MEINYRKLLVEIMKNIVENDYWRITIDDEGNISGEGECGFILEHSILRLGNNFESDLRKEFRVPNEIPLQQLKLGDGNIFEIYLRYDSSIYDDEEMEKICDDIYLVLGEKFGIMEIGIA